MSQFEWWDHSQGRNTREENIETGVKRREKTEKTKGYEVSASLLSTFSTLAAAQIYRLFLLHQESAQNGKKKKKRITFKSTTEDIQQAT